MTDKIKHALKLAYIKLIDTDGFRPIGDATVRDIKAKEQILGAIHSFEPDFTYEDESDAKRLFERAWSLRESYTPYKLVVVNENGAYNGNKTVEVISYPFPGVDDEGNPCVAVMIREPNDPTTMRQYDLEWPNG